MFSFHRVLAYDFETLQFVADFKTTLNDPNALYFVSSRFHRFFLKNVNALEINTRVMRIGNVVQSTPYNSFGASFPAVPQFSQNSISPFVLSNSHIPQPTSPTSFFPQPSTAPAAYSLSAYPLPAKANYAFSYNIEQPPQQQYPTKSNGFFPSITHHNQPSYQLLPTTSAISFPTASAAPSYNSATSFFKFRGASPYAFNRFSLIDKRSEYPFQQLNGGETIPHPSGTSSSYMNINFGDSASDGSSSSLTGEVYRPSRFSRSANVTTSF